MRLPETEEEAAAERLWLEYRRKDIRKEKDPSKRLLSFAYIGDLQSVLQLLPERVYAFCAGGHGHTSTARLLLDRGADAFARNGRDPFRPVLSGNRTIPHEDKREIGKALLATMRARTARLEAENAELKSRLARYEARGD